MEMRKGGESRGGTQADSVDKTTAVTTCGLRWIAVALTLAGAVLVFVSPAIAFPLIATGMALVAIEQTDKRRGRRH